MYIRRDKRKSGSTTIRIVEGRRVNGKVRQKHILHIDTVRTEAGIRNAEAKAKKILGQFESGEMYINRLGRISVRKTTKRKYTKRQKIPSSGCPTCGKGQLVASDDIPDAVKLNEVSYNKHSNDGVFSVFGHVYDSLGLNKFIDGTSDDKLWNEVFKSLVVARIVSPDSKHATAKDLARNFHIDHPLHQYYLSMDKAIICKDQAMEMVLRESKKLHGGQIRIALFDVTTLYFESTEQDGLRENGYSKDGKFAEVQVVLSLMTTVSGYPIGYKLFPGNTSEGQTLLEHIIEMKNKFDLQGITIVGDRAMSTKANFEAMDKQGIKYIIGCRLRTLKRKFKEQILNDKESSLAKSEEDIPWQKTYELNGRRLLVAYSPSRAHHDREKRQRMIDKVTKKVRDGKMKANDAVSNHGVKKFLDLKGVTLKMNHQAMEEESRWDGIFGIITDDDSYSTEEVFDLRHQLWRIEDAFRFNKSDLKMRPVYHWKKERIEAHILICYLAFSVSRFTMQRINADRASDDKISFDDCLDTLDEVGSVVMTECEPPPEKKNHYVFPTQLTDKQKDIFTRVGLTTRRSSFMK